MKKILSLIVVLFCYIGILLAANVDNYFQRPIGNKDNTFVVGGTQNVSGTINVSGTLNATGNVAVSSITATNQISAGRLTDGTAVITGGNGSGFKTISVSTATITGAQGLRFSVVVDTTTAPAAANILAVNSASELYISTGTGAGAWVKVGAQ